MSFDVFAQAFDSGDAGKADSKAWDVIVRAAGASSLVIMPVGCPVAMTDPASIDDLPYELRPDANVVRNGPELLALIQGST